MGTEKFWQGEKDKMIKNADNIHPVIKQTMEDAKALVPPRHSKALFQDCLQGALYWNQLAQQEDLTLPEMGMIICRDVGCELTYCQASISDPYERPFENCDQQFKQLNKCIAQEQVRYQTNPEGRTMQEHVAYMLEKKKKEKYMKYFEPQVMEVPREREYIIKEQNKVITMNDKL